MKIKTPVATAIFATTILFSCVSQTKEDAPLTSETDNIIDSAAVASELIDNTIDYADDWKLIKEAILNHEASVLNGFIVDENEVNAANLIELCSEDYVVEELKVTEYTDLLESDFNGSPAKEFGASIEFIDPEDGTEYGSGISIYLNEGLTGLRITYVLAAG